MPFVDDGWNFACPDWEARLRSGTSLIPQLPLDRAMVKRAVTIFNKLHLPDVRSVDGSPIPLLDAAGDWQRDIVAALFGSVVDGVRRVGELFVLVPKKNSKTTNAAAIMLTAMLMERQPKQMFYLYGPTQEIADRGWAQAEGMIDVDPEGVLQKRFKVRKHLKMIEDLRTGCALKVQTFDAKVATGAIPKGQCIDEVHILGTMAHAADTLEQIRGNMQARPDAFLLQITTQSDKPPAGVFKRELALARSIRDGRFTGEGVRMLPVLYEFPESVQTDPARPWADPANWPMVLPNLGRSVRIDLLRSAWLAAQEKGEEEVRRWASQHLNIEVGLALHSDRWRGADYWEGTADSSVAELDDLLARCEVATIGIDGGGLDDLFGLAVVGRERVTKRWLVWVHAWAQPEVFEQRKDIASRLTDFVRDGDLTLCDRVDQDIAEVVETCSRVRAAGVLPQREAIGLDPQGVGALIDALTEADFTLNTQTQGTADGQLVPVGQGYRLFSAVSTSERKLKSKAMVHGGSPMMAWCVANAKAEQRDNAVVLTKAAAGKAKIDPLIAMLVAVKLMEKGPEAAGGPSVYEARGPIII